MRPSMHQLYEELRIRLSPLKLVRCVGVGVVGLAGMGILKREVHDI
jgi:hypothetical protein